MALNPPTKLQRIKNRTTMSKTFVKNDAGFVCVHCGYQVPPLYTTSRDHCPRCLYSLHVDVNPGDRANPCHGELVPIGIEHNSKKGLIINYHCDTCGEYHNNKAAPDDDYDTILELSANPLTYLYPRKHWKPIRNYLTLTKPKIYLY